MAHRCTHHGTRTKESRRIYGALQCVAVCSSVLHCVAVCCSMMAHIPRSHVAYMHQPWHTHVPMYSEKSPIYSEKSPAYSEKSLIYSERRPIQWKTTYEREWVTNCTYEAYILKHPVMCHGTHVPMYSGKSRTCYEKSPAYSETALYILKGGLYIWNTTSCAMTHIAVSRIYRPLYIWLFSGYAYICTRPGAIKRAAPRMRHDTHTHTRTHVQHDTFVYVPACIRMCHVAYTNEPWHTCSLDSEKRPIYCGKSLMYSEKRPIYLRSCAF